MTAQATATELAEHQVEVHREQTRNEELASQIEELRAQLERPRPPRAPPPTPPEELEEEH